MRAGEFLEFASRFADHAQHLAVERNLEDAPGKSRFADEHHLVRPGGMQIELGAPIAWLRRSPVGVVP